MIYVRSWDSACPALFSAPTIDEARALKEKIKDLKDRVEVVEGQRDEARITLLSLSMPTTSVID